MRAKAGNRCGRRSCASTPAATDPYTEATSEQLFGGLWARPGLARRDRRLTTLTVIAARGDCVPGVPPVGSALLPGDLTADELHEWVVHLAFYAGWPVGADALRGAACEVLAHPTSPGSLDAPSLSGGRGIPSAGHRDDLALHLVHAATERADRRLSVRLLELAAQHRARRAVDEVAPRSPTTSMSSRKHRHCCSVPSTFIADASAGFRFALVERRGNASWRA